VARSGRRRHTRARLSGWLMRATSVVRVQRFALETCAGGECRLIRASVSVWPAARGTCPRVRQLDRSIVSEKGHGRRRTMIHVPRGSCSGRSPRSSPGTPAARAAAESVRRRVHPVRLLGDSRPECRSSTSASCCSCHALGPRPPCPDHSLQAERQRYGRERVEPRRSRQAQRSFGVSLVAHLHDSDRSTATSGYSSGAP
jgi:hypothetical protein